MNNFISFVGKLHPILVHLPIGMIIAAICLEWFSLIKKNNTLTSATKNILWFGFFAGIASIVTGYILSLDASNNENTVTYHKWFAIATNIFLLLILLFWKQINQIVGLIHFMFVALLILLLITGHFGGVLTHGENYLSNKSNAIKHVEGTLPLLGDIKSADPYKDVVQIIMNEKCISCHGLDKQKGKLRLDDYDMIFKGGKSGSAINLDSPEKSEILKRILLDISDDHHMPPQKQKQLTASEKKIIEWWISNKCPANKTIGNIQTSVAIKESLNIYKKERNNVQSNEININRPEVEKISTSTNEKLLKLGYIVSQVAENDNHVRVSSFNPPSSFLEVLPILKDISTQLVELKIHSPALNDTDIEHIDQLQSLEKLWLVNSTVSNKCIENIVKLKTLNFLDISNSKITEDGIKILLNLKSMKKIIALNTSVSAEKIDFLRQQRRDLIINIRQDTMENLASDTLFMKRK